MQGRVEPFLGGGAAGGPPSPHEDHERHAFVPGERPWPRLVLAVVVVVGSFVAIVTTVRWLQGPMVPTPAAANSQKQTFWPTGRVQAQALEMARQADQQRAAQIAKQAEARDKALLAQRQANQLAMAKVAEAQAAADRREAAWSRFYKPSPPCRNPDNRATMDCINEHIRAKREFDRRWQAGEL